jgi:predicted ArsR family transcriptional regulator
MPNSRADVEAVSLLAEPVRGALYEWVAGAGGAVGRDEAAAALGIARALAAFHLDRLVAGGLLVAEFRRLSGRSGPGAGRPSKLYRPAARTVAVSLPRRRYEVPAELFAKTIERLNAQVPPDSLRDAAYELGQTIGSAARRSAGARPSQRRLREVLLATLAERDYRPHVGSGEIRIENCPFQALVEEHRPLVCGMNLSLIEGLVSGIGLPRHVARPDSRPDQCCVAVGRI